MEIKKKVRLLIFVLFVLLLSTINACADNNPPATIFASPAETKKQIQVDPQHLELAYDYLVKNRIALGLKNPRKELKLIAYQADKLDFKHIKFQQLFNNVPVWNSFLTVHINVSDIVYRVSGQPYQDIGDINTTPALSAKEAGEHAVQTDTTDNGNWKPEKAELCIFLDGHTGRLAYEVTVTKGFVRKFVFIDAMNGELIKTLTGTYTN